MSRILCDILKMRCMTQFFDARFYTPVSFKWRSESEKDARIWRSIFSRVETFMVPFYHLCFIFQLSGKWINLLRAFKKLDRDNNDFLSLQEFRHVLELCNVVLDEDDIYHILTEFDDSKNGGKIRYTKFLDKIK